MGFIGTLTDITDRKRADDALRTAQEELHRLATGTERAREAERRWIAHEIHDELGQLLTGIKMDASWLVQRVSHDAAAQQKFAGMLELIDDTVDAMRRIATALRPVVLDDLGLAVATKWQVREFTKHSGLNVRLDITPEEFPQVEPERATAAFRVLQETLTNVARHAHATRVHVALSVMGEQLELRVQDDGTGFDPADTRGRVGIIGMRERARFWGGVLEVASEAGHGTRVTLRLPLRAVGAGERT